MTQSDASRAFLDQVLASPDDNVPRLIYADYLEEVGDPRGEFIRLQCELDELDTLDENYIDGSHRCDELLYEHREQWAAELKQDVRKAEFARGFIDQITIRARVFIKEADQLYRTTPVNWLRFNYVKGAGIPLAATEALSNVRSLDLGGLVIPDDDLGALLTSPHLNQMTALRLAHYDAAFSNVIGKTLGEMPSTKVLKHLAIPAGSEFLDSVGSTGGFPELERLEIYDSYNEGSIAGLAKFKVPKLKKLKVRVPMTFAHTKNVCALPVHQLTDLDLESSHLPAKGLKLLGEKGALDNIQTLSLASCGLGVRAADVLFTGNQLAECRSLNLSYNRDMRREEDARFVDGLVAHEPLSKLEVLRISGLQHGDLARLVQCNRFHTLKELEIEDGRFSPEDVIAIGASPLADSLRHLKLTGCDLPPNVVGQFGKGAVFPNLLRLTLGGGYDDFNLMDDASVTMLLSCDAFPKLQSVNLDHMFIKTDTFIEVAKTANVPELREISFCHNRMSRKAVDAVMNSNRLPKLAKLVLTGASGLGNREKLLNDYGWRTAF